MGPAGARLGLLVPSAPPRPPDAVVPRPRAPEPQTRNKHVTLLDRKLFGSRSALELGSRLWRRRPGVPVSTTSVASWEPAASGAGLRLRASDVLALSSLVRRSALGAKGFVAAMRNSSLFGDGVQAAGLASPSRTKAGRGQAAPPSGACASWGAGPHPSKTASPSWALRGLWGPTGSPRPAPP